MSNSVEAKQTFAKLDLLNAIKILVCRPEPSASGLTQALEAMGAQCLNLPMLRIEAIDISAAEREHILNLDQYTRVIVVSQHAAELGIELIDNYWPQAPISQKWYAIGRKTAEALNSSALDISPPDQDFTSEKLLDNKELQSIQGEKILILKGQHGRELIEKELKSRGAEVDTISVYHRVCPVYDSSDLEQHITDFSPDYIIALSGETLTNLISYCREYNIDISERSFILSSTRVANIAYENGLRHAYIPENLMPMDIVKCIKNAQRKLS